MPPPGPRRGAAATQLPSTGTISYFLKVYHHDHRVSGQKSYSGILLSDFCFTPGILVAEWMN